MASEFRALSIGKSGAFVNRYGPDDGLPLEGRLFFGA
jgi:hypothetical protein